MTAEVAQTLALDPDTGGPEAVRTAFGVLAKSIQDGAIPDPLPKLPRFLEQAVTTLSDSLPLIPSARTDGVASGAA